MENRIYASGGSGNFRFSLVDGKNLGIEMDSTGKLTWMPDYDFVDRLEESKDVPVIIEVRDNEGNIAKKQVSFTVVHVNREPTIGELKNFYIRYGQENNYQIDLNAIIDPDNDPVIFKSIPQSMPEGAQLSEKGLFSWKPSLSQFSRLKSDPIRLPFLVEDQPYKAEVRGYFNILATQMDLPPEIAMIPKSNQLRVGENETVNFKFFLSDPNGDEDITSFDVLSDDPRIGDQYLRKNTTTQWEFIWTPEYDFVKVPGDSIRIDLRFYVVDKSFKRDEHQVTIVVEDRENQVRKDQLLYNQYRTALVRVWDLLEQLKTKEKEYYKALKKARKGKKNRAIVDASLGAITGISPVVLTEANGLQNEGKIVTGVGGTTVMTLGTLEATDMIGKSPSDILENLNRVIEKKNELQLQGDIFARHYSLISSRRDQNFNKDTEKLLALLIIKNVASLELNAGWENPKKITDKLLQNTFEDFMPEEF